MRLIYAYVRHRNFSWEQFTTDGHYALLRALQKTDLVDEVEIILNNYAVPSRLLHAEPGLRVHSLKEIDEFETRPGDVVWIRGAWKPWIPWIEKAADVHKCWLIHYSANAGHHQWPWWDAILWDLAAGNKIGRESKLWWHYRKPVCPEFRIMPEVEQEYDVCCGASHIYDRKGQFRILPICHEFKKLTGRDLRVIMPGAFYSREKKTEAMKAEMKAGKWPNIFVPGWLTREGMIRVYNMAHVFYAATCGGQGDRCVPESGACGARQIVGLPKNHPPYAYETPIAFVPEHQDDFSGIARHLFETLEGSAPDREAISDYFRQESSVETAIDYLRPLLEHMRDNPKNRETLKELL